MSWLTFIVLSLTLVGLTSASCTAPQWIKTDNKKVASSTAAASGDGNLTNCEGACLKLLNCVAIDFTDDKKCSLTSNADAALVADNKNTHYAAQRTCTANGITCVYKSVGQYQFAGEIYTTTGTNTLDDCVAGCTNSSCTAFAWNPYGSLSCIKTSAAVSSKTASDSYTALVKQDCTGDCEPYTWDKKTNKMSEGSTRTSAGDESAFACQLQCLRNTNCVGVDFKSLPKQCYIQTNANAKLNGKTGTTHYAADQDCNGSNGAMTGYKTFVLAQVALLTVMFYI